MNILDVVLLLSVVVFAVSGYQRGLLAGVISLAAFVGGASLGVWLLPFVVDPMEPETMASTFVALLVVLVPAGVAQGLAWPLAERLRESLTRAPARWVDGVGGAVLNALAVLLVSWIVASTLSPTPSPDLNRAIQDSSVLGGVQERMPEGAPTWFSRASNALNEAGFPRVYNPFENIPSTEVPAPSGDSVTEATIIASQRSTVKIAATSGFSGQAGSGFVYADERVLTNAHVVDGASATSVRVGGAGQELAAEVVLLDPDTDVAVLAVPGLRAPPLSMTEGSDEASRGDPAVVAGYPEDGPLDLQAATVAGRFNARGQDIHGESLVTRDIYSIRSTVLPGNSGGPLLTPTGQVYGMVFARSVEDASTGYVLTADQIRAVL